MIEWWRKNEMRQLGIIHNETSDLDSFHGVMPSCCRIIYSKISEENTAFQHFVQKRCQQVIYFGHEVMICPVSKIEAIPEHT